MRLFKVKDEEIISADEDQILAKIALNKAKARVAATRNTRVGLIIVASIMITMPIVRYLPESITDPYRIILGVVIGIALAGIIAVLLSLHYPQEVKKEYERQLLEVKARGGEKANSQ